jgi:hypothetical protein
VAVAVVAVEVDDGGEEDNDDEDEDDDDEWEYDVEPDRGSSSWRMALGEKLDVTLRLLVRQCPASALAQTRLSERSCSLLVTTLLR